MPKLGDGVPPFVNFGIFDGFIDYWDDQGNYWRRRDMPFRFSKLGNRGFQIMGFVDPTPLTIREMHELFLKQQKTENTNDKA